jgi:hypothetical protein
MKSTKYDDQQNISFVDQMDPYMYSVSDSVDETRTLQDSNDADLANFFSRPIKIAEEEWTTNVTLSFDLDPWSAYFDNPRVSNRLSNFNLLRAKLRLKVLINGNGFQYGRLLMSYLPFDVYDNLSTNAALIREDLVQASQQPHIFLDPTTSTGGELCVPMFLHTNSMHIPFSQWSELGRLYCRTLNTLKHANGATDKVTVSVFAWAEDVSMSVLTSVDTDTLIPQSGEITEANTKGTISGPATAVSNFMATLAGVPYIGPFARATQIGAGAVAGMAKIFGYSRPPVTKAPDPYRPTPVSSLAVTNVPDVCQKLTVDELQELTIDPRISGLGGADPLNIREIAKRESYLTTFTWTMGTAPETLLWNARVDPVQWAESSFGGDTGFHFPACAFAALPFQYWKGTMRFRFQVVCSNFHKGRLKFVYDPNFIDTNEYNTNYVRIVDIAEEQDFTLEFGNGQEVSFLEHHYPCVDSVTQMYSTSKYTSKEAGNGVVGVYIVNELTTPNDTVNNDVEVNVFVSMGDDFEVAVPEDFFTRFTLFPQTGELEAQSGTIVPDSQETSEPSAPQQEMSSTVGMGETNDKNLNSVFFGEAIQSFRTLLKRYTLWNTIPKLLSGPTLVSGRFSNIPYFRGSNPDGVDSAVTGPYNFCNTILLHWVLSAYSGHRGSTRWKIVPRGHQELGDRVCVERVPFKATQPNYQVQYATMPQYTAQSTARAAALAQKDGVFQNLLHPLFGANGSALTVAQVNGTLEFETPYYAPFRFSPGKRAVYTDFMLFDGAWDYRVEYCGDGAKTTTATHDVYSAIGEDFQVYFFTGLPRMYCSAVNPDANASGGTFTITETPLYTETEVTGFGPQGPIGGDFDDYIVTVGDDPTPVTPPVIIDTPGDTTVTVTDPGTGSVVAEDVIKIGKLGAYVIFSPEVIGDDSDMALITGSWTGSPNSTSGGTFHITGMGATAGDVWQLTGRVNQTNGGTYSLKGQNGFSVQTHSLSANSVFTVTFVSGTTEGAEILFRGFSNLVDPFELEEFRLTNLGPP